MPPLQLHLSCRSERTKEKGGCEPRILPLRKVRFAFNYMGTLKKRMRKKSQSSLVAEMNCATPIAVEGRI